MVHKGQQMEQKNKVPGLFRNAKATHTFPAGTTIFNAGDEGSEMFGIIEGAVEIRGDAGVVGRLGPGDVFGEMALVDESPRSATAVAAADTVVAAIDRHRFLFLVQETPTFALEVMTVMAERTRQRT